MSTHDNPMPDVPKAAPTLLLTFLAAALTVVVGVVVTGITDSYWAAGGAFVALCVLLVGVLAQLGHELREEQ
jgi:hypothetical protein